MCTYMACSVLRDGARRPMIAPQSVAAQRCPLCQNSQCRRSGARHATGRLGRSAARHGMRSPAGGVFCRCSGERAWARARFRTATPAPPVRPTMRPASRVPGGGAQSRPWGPERSVAGAAGGRPSATASPSPRKYRPPSQRGAYPTDRSGGVTAHVREGESSLDGQQRPCAFGRRAALAAHAGRARRRARPRARALHVGGPARHANVARSARAGGGGRVGTRARGAREIGTKLCAARAHGGARSWKP